MDNKMDNKNISRKINFINIRAQRAINLYMPCHVGDDADKIRMLIERHLLNIITLRAKNDNKDYRDFLKFKDFTGHNYIDFMIFTLGDKALISFSIDYEPKEVRLEINLNELIDDKNVNDFNGIEFSLEKKYK
ncbi:MAG: hypothetical protein J6Q61_02860 [Bacteroidales bacterium]|nr:hypothetical protein [Bacteroidales bacterium]MBO5853657.1 hypothetical protein [Bacteroidales bacterium]